MVSKVETEYSNYDFEVSLEGISPKLNSIGNDPLTQRRNDPVTHLLSYIRSGASKPSRSILCSRTRRVSSSSAIHELFCASSSYVRIFVS